MAGGTDGRCYVRYEALRELQPIIQVPLDGRQKGEIWAMGPKDIKPPAGEVYHVVESPRGEQGFYIVSKGSEMPYRMRFRSPSFVNLQALPSMCRGRLIADVVAIIGSIDIVLGDVDR